MAGVPAEALAYGPEGRLIQEMFDELYARIITDPQPYPAEESETYSVPKGSICSQQVPEGKRPSVAKKNCKTTAEKKVKVQNHEPRSDFKQKYWKDPLSELIENISFNFTKTDRCVLPEDSTENAAQNSDSDSGYRTSNSVVDYEKVEAPLCGNMKQDKESTIKLESLKTTDSMTDNIIPISSEVPPVCDDALALDVDYFAVHNKDKADGYCSDDSNASGWIARPVKPKLCTERSTKVKGLSKLKGDAATSKKPSVVVNNVKQRHINTNKSTDKGNSAKSISTKKSNAVKTLDKRKGETVKFGRKRAAVCTTNKQCVPVVHSKRKQSVTMKTGLTPLKKRKKMDNKENGSIISYSKKAAKGKAASTRKTTANKPTLDKTKRKIKNAKILRQSNCSKETPAAKRKLRTSSQPDGTCVEELEPVEMSDSHQSPPKEHFVYTEGLSALELKDSPDGVGKEWTALDTLFPDTRQTGGRQTRSSRGLDTLLRSCAHTGGVWNSIISES